MKKNVIIQCLFMSFFFLYTQAQDVRSLAGSWQFSLDQEDKGINEQWYSKKLPLSINLPGTTDEGGYGMKTSGSDFGILTRQFKYYGPAWYQTDIVIPDDWKGKRIFLNLERVTWESKVYLDEKEVSTKDALSTAHLHDLGMVSAGRHRLTIRINNAQIHNIGDKGHLYTEYTQSIWNGVVGKIELIAKNTTRFNNPQTYTEISPKKLLLNDTLINEDGKVRDLWIELKLRPLGENEILFSKSKKVRVGKDKYILKLEEIMPEAVELWSDMAPNMYLALLHIRDTKGAILDEKEVEIGFREISASKSKIFVNGKPVFFRGNLDCVHFPLTGYPAMTVEEWQDIFKIYKNYGLNHVRFHSWCPPEAAFRAANRVGLYLQPEVIWLDWWMAVDNPGREEMNTQGRPKGLGHNPSADAFVQREIYRMFAHYGNHPSFTTMSIGNELGNSDFNVMESWLKPYKEKDNRRLYAISSARKITAMDQFIATHHIDKLGATRGIQGAHTDWDFEKTYAQSDIPVIAHEIGQWPVYPRWSEIKKYKGVLKARNLEGFQQQARENNIEVQNEEFVRASGALNQIMYKYEIESFLRTPSAAGIQLLSMQDYQGQGEALVGWLDVFYNSKGITTPEKFKMHHDTTVTLLRTPKFVWHNSELFKAKVQLAHYGTQDLDEAILWKIKDEQSRLIAQGDFSKRTFQMGTSTIVGEIEVDLSTVLKASKLIVEVELDSRAVHNEWNIWVYPDVKAKVVEGVHVATRFDKTVEQVLSDGGSVLLDATALGTVETADLINFYPLYWSLTFFPGQGKNTIGMVVRDKHPALSNFPTDSHSDWQWQSIYKGAKGFYINDFSADFRPIAQPIDDFHRNNKLGTIFEVRVGKGKLLVCGFDLQNEQNMVSQQLKASLLGYMNTAEFNPTYAVDASRLRKMFTYVEPLMSVIPSEFSNAILYIEAGKNSKKINQNSSWNTSLDQYELRKQAKYRVVADGVWKDDISSAWQGKDVEVELNVPQGMIGSLYVFLHDWNNNGRTADITFEGRDYTVEEHDKEGKWVKLHVMREDSNDGLLKLKVRAKKGPNVMVSKLALLEEVE